MQQAESEVLINRNNCSIHSRRSVVSASEMSHEWCEVSRKIDRATAVAMSRRGARGHITKRKDETIHTTDVVDAPPDTTTQRNSAQHELALCDRCHTVWASGAHGWVAAGHPRYTRADYDQEAVGGSTSRARVRDTRHRHKLCTRVATKQPGSGIRVQSTRSMAAEHPQHVSGARVRSTEASVHGSAPATVTLKENSRRHQSRCTFTLRRKSGCC